MKKIILLFVGVVLLLSPSLVFGRSAADVIFYHYRTVPHEDQTIQGNVTPFPLFPQEQEISNFPSPVDKNQTDLAVLHRYYAMVAQAYEDYFEGELSQKLTDYKLKMAEQQQHMHIRQARSQTGKNQFARHLTAGRGEIKGQDRIEQAARVQAIGYYSKAYRDLSERRARVEKQAAFYQELATISEELYKGEIH